MGGEELTGTGSWKGSDRISLSTGSFLSPADLTFRFTRSGGPGGQNVNKVATRVEVFYNVRTATTLTPSDRERLLSRLAGRLDSEGNLRVVSQSERTQSGNRRKAVEKLVALLHRALKMKNPRHPTSPTAASREKRIGAKKRRSEILRGRKAVEED